MTGCFPALADQGLRFRLVGRRVHQPPTLRSRSRARAASGHAAAPPTSVTKSRRLIEHLASFFSKPRVWRTAGSIAQAYRRMVRVANLPPTSRQVFGPNLNRSEKQAGHRPRLTISRTHPSAMPVTQLFPGTNSSWSLSSSTDAIAIPCSIGARGRSPVVNPPVASPADHPSSAGGVRRPTCWLWK